MALPPTNPNGLVRDAEDLNKVINGDGTTNRAGDSLPSIKAVLERINDEFDAMQSGELTAQAVDAADRAETARDAAFVNADVYPYVAAGIAAVEVGEQFQTVSGDELARWEKTSESPYYVEVARYPSKDFVLNNIDNARMSYSGVLAAQTDSDVNFDFDSDILTIESARIRYNEAAILVDHQTVSLPFVYGYLVFNRPTGIVRVVSRTTSMSDGDILIGMYDKRLYLVHGVPMYRINGQPSKTYTRGELISSDPSRVNFVFSERKLIIGGGVVRVNRGSQLTSVVDPQEVSLSPEATAVIHVLVFNPMTGMITSKSTSSDTYSYGDIQIGEYHSGSGSVFGIGIYSINGVDARPTRTPITQAYFKVVNGVTDASYVQPALGGFEWITDAVHTDMYALYDAIMDDYPEYVTRTLMGQDTIGNDLFRYDFKPPSFHNESAGYPGAAKMILVTGIHGYEKAGIYATYSAMKEICTRWQDDERLETLRWGVHFIVVPVASPYGFDNNTRTNERGVDMERNFPTEWDAGRSDPESNQYRGPSPLSEPVVGYIDEILSQNTDALYYCSFHNMELPGRFIWNASATRFGIQAAQRLISRSTVSWDKRYTRTSGDEYIGYSEFTAFAGTSPRHAANRYNIQGGTFEISRRAAMYGEEILWGPMVATLGTEAFINWLLINLEYGAQLKNSSVRVVG